MNISKRQRIKRRQFWFPFLVVQSIQFFFLLVYANLSLELFIILEFILIGLYLGGYIHGHIQGRESMRQVMDYMEPGLRWKVFDAEEQMYDREDWEYYESQRMKNKF